MIKAGLSTEERLPYLHKVAYVCEVCGRKNLAELETGHYTYQNWRHTCLCYGKYSITLKYNDDVSTEELVAEVVRLEDGLSDEEIKRLQIRSMVTISSAKLQHRPTTYWREVEIESQSTMHDSEFVSSKELPTCWTHGVVNWGIGENTLVRFWEKLHSQGLDILRADYPCFEGELGLEGAKNFIRQFPKIIHCTYCKTPSYPKEDRYEHRRVGSVYFYTEKEAHVLLFGRCLQDVEWPEETTGSKLAAEARKECNLLSYEERQELLRKGMEMINGGVGKATQPS